MKPTLQRLLTATELAMLAYWLVASLACLGVLSLPHDWMYTGYGEPIIDAWNWSFMPIDVLFAVSGLAAAHLAMGEALRARLHDASLVLMFCAGLMALSFWAFRGEFEPAWWAMNLWLVGLSTVAFTCRLPSSPAQREKKGTHCAAMGEMRGR